MYIPVTKGMPAILVHPMTSWMANVANVIPAIISQGICEGLRGQTLWKMGDLWDLLEFCADGILALNPLI